MATDSEKILTNAQGVKRASGDQGSAETHSIESQIKAVQFDQANKAARSRNPFAGVMRRARPPGGNGV